MRLTKDQKRECIVHLRLAGIRFQKDIEDGDDGELIARNVKSFLAMLPAMDLNGQMAIRRIEKLCDDIIASKS